MEDRVFALIVFAFLLLSLVQYIYITEREFEKRKKQREDERRKNEARDRSKKA